MFNMGWSFRVLHPDLAATLPTCGLCPGAPGHVLICIALCHPRQGRASICPTSGPQR